MLRGVLLLLVGNIKDVCHCAVYATERLNVFYRWYSMGHLTTFDNNTVSLLSLDQDHSTWVDLGW